MLRNSLNRKVCKRPAIAALFVFALVGAASLAAQDPQDVATTPLQPSRVWMKLRVPMRPNGTKVQDMELDFNGANGTVTGLSARSGKQTIRFERAEEAVLSCPRGRVKECDSLSLKDGGELTACACLPPGPVSQTKEHILLARQVGVPSMMTESSQPKQIAAGPASPETSYEVALSDKTILLATAGGAQTCWIEKKMPMTLCY